MQIVIIRSINTPIKMHQAKQPWGWCFLYDIIGKHFVSFSTQILVRPFSFHVLFFCLLLSRSIKWWTESLFGSNHLETNWERTEPNRGKTEKDMEAAMPGKTLMWIMISSLLITVHVHGVTSQMGHFSRSDYRDQMRRLQEFKASLTGRDSGSFVAPSSVSPAPSPNYSPPTPVIQQLYF